MQRRSALILMYHNVVDTTSGAGALVNVNHVSAASFQWQVESLREHYNVVPLLEIVERLKSNRSIERLAAITFDDGYCGVYSTAAPILSALGLPSTVFLVAGCMEDNQMTWYDRVEAPLLFTSHRRITIGGTAYSLEGHRPDVVRSVKNRLKLMDLDARDAMIAELEQSAGPITAEQSAPYQLMGWNQVRALQSQGMSFGVHTYSHPHLSRVTPNNLKLEIDRAASVISDRLSMPLNELIFSYPDGDYDKSIRDYVEGTGMCGAVAVDNSLVRPGADPFAIPRVAVGREFSQVAFADATVGFTRALKGSIRHAR